MNGNIGSCTHESREGRIGRRGSRTPPEAVPGSRHTAVLHVALTVTRAVEYVAWVVFATVYHVGAGIQRRRLPYGSPNRARCSASVNRGAPSSIQSTSAASVLRSCASARRAFSSASGGTGNTRDELRCSSHATV